MNDIKLFHIQVGNLEDALRALKHVKFETILEYIESEKFMWNGTDNGDSESLYQGRLLEKYALVMMVASKVISVGDDLTDLIEGKIDLGISRDQAEKFFYKHIVPLSNDYSKGNYANENLRLDLLPNFYKYVANYIPKGER